MRAFLYILAGLVWLSPTQGLAIQASAGLAALRSQETPAASPELAEANELSEKAKRLITEGKAAEAISPARKSLKLYEKHLAKDAEPLLEALNILAFALTLNGEHDEAVKFFKRVVEARESKSGPKDAATVRALNNLATAHVRNKDYKQAAPLYERVLASKEQDASLENDEGATLLLLYSCVKRSLKEPDAADELEGRALKILYKLSGGQLEAVTFPESCTNLKAFEKPAPSYPVEARTARMMGEIRVEVLVDETGKVISATALNGHTSLRQASVEAAHRAKFKPLAVEGKPLKLKGYITYIFTLR